MSKYRLKMIEYFHWDRPFLHRPEKWWCVFFIFINVTLASTAVTIDLAALIPTMGEIGGALNIDSTKTLFIPRLYMFFMGIGPLIAVRLGKIYGYKRTLFVSMWIFMLAAVGASNTASYAVVLLLRSIGGLAGGVILGCGLPIINHHVPENKRRIFVTLHTSISFGLGIALGLLIGGYLGQMQMWQWVFWINGYIFAFVLVCTLLFHAESPKQKMEPYDYRGLISVTCFTLLLFFVVSQVKAPWVTDGWRSPIIWASLAAALFFLTNFILHSLTAPAPLFDMRVFICRPFVYCFMGIVIVGFMVFGVTMSSALMLQNIFGYDHYRMGIFMSQVGLAYFFVGGITSYLIYYWNPRYFIYAGLSLIAISCFVSQKITIQSTPFELATPMWIRSIGVALTLGPLTVLGSASFEKELYSKATALITFARQMSGVFGSSLITMIASMREPLHLTRYAEQAATARAANGEFVVKLAKWRPEQFLRKWIEDQAIIQSLLDAELILGYLTLAVLAILGTAMFCAMIADHKKRPLVLD